MNSNEVPGPAGGTTTWTEGDSTIFQKYGDVFAPHRELQLKLILECLRLASPESARIECVLELGVGHGKLAEAILEEDIAKTVIGVDSSLSMLDAAVSCLRRFSDRFVPVSSNLKEVEASLLPLPVSCAVSSLAIHHLDSMEKQELFRTIFGMLPPGGQFVLADMGKSVSSVSKQFFARRWNESVAHQCLNHPDSDASWKAFKSSEWNFYEEAAPDGADKPDLVGDQIRWLQNCGFEAVELLWSDAGHFVVAAKKPSSTLVSAAAAPV